MRFARHFISAFAILIASAQANDFIGWQTMRVIEHEGYPTVLRAADIDADGQQELYVVNSRFSRIDIYGYESTPGSTDNTETSYENPNTLPPAPNIKHSEIQLERLPSDTLAVPHADQTRQQLAVLVQTPNRLLLYDLATSGKWQLDRQIDLLDGEYASYCPEIMLLHRTPKQIKGTTNRKEVQPSVLIAMQDGIQQVSLGSDRVAWLEPREKQQIVDWWLADLDGDGIKDIVKQSNAAERTLGWLRGDQDGHFEPTRPLLDRPVTDVRVLGGFAKAPVIVLDGVADGLVRRYSYSQGEATPMGRLRPLPLAGGRTPAWCGMRQGDSSVVVTASADSPELKSYKLGDNGWSAGGTFPSVGDVKALVSPLAEPETLLVWVKDSAALHRSHWDGTRLSYPKIWPQSENDEERKILALSVVGTTTWWASQVGSDVELYIWEKNQPEPKLTRFVKIGSTVEAVRWMGGKRILIQDRRARGLRIATAATEPGEKAAIDQPSGLARGDLSEFSLLSVGDQLRVARLADGVLQWLDDDMQPDDQIMLPNGKELVGFIPETLTSGWALEKGAPHLHRIEPNDSGVASATTKHKIAEAVALVDDPHVGLIMVGRDRLIQATAGRPDKLEQLQALDRRSTRSSGSKRANCHRFLVTDLNLDGKTDLLLCDDRKHKLTAVMIQDNSLEPKATWPIFEDLSYPYSDYEEDLISEPRAACALDIDGDNHPDLALLCHDRLLIYLGREPK